MIISNSKSPSICKHASPGSKYSMSGLTDHAVVHEVNGGKLESLLASVETVDGVITVRRIGHYQQTRQLTTQVLSRATTRTWYKYNQPDVKLLDTNQQIVTAIIITHSIDSSTCWKWNKKSRNNFGRGRILTIRYIVPSHSHTPFPPKMPPP